MAAKHFQTSNATEEQFPSVLLVLQPVGIKTISTNIVSSVDKIYEARYAGILANRNTRNISSYTDKVNKGSVCSDTNRVKFMSDCDKNNYLAYLCE